MAGGILLRNAVTSGNGTPFDCRGVGGRYRLSVIGTGTISSGAVQWEHAPTADYAGTWAALGTAITPISGAVVEQVVDAVLNVVRARCSTAIGGGGSVTVRMQPPLLPR
jgi:hypothetical protein